MPFHIIRNDITKVKADAIVNTANPEVAVGSGVDYAIYKASGMENLLAEREKIGYLSPGEVGITKAFNLEAKFIIHVSGPRWENASKGEEAILRKCYDKALNLAFENGCESIAFPVISTGTYGFPQKTGIQIAVDAFTSFLEEHEIDITLVVFGDESVKISGEIVDEVSSYIDDSYVKMALAEEKIPHTRESMQEFGQLRDSTPDEEKAPQDNKEKSSPVRVLFSRIAGKKAERDRCAENTWDASDSVAPKNIQDEEAGDLATDIKDEEATNLAADIKDEEAGNLSQADTESCAMLGAAATAGIEDKEAYNLSQADTESCAMLGAAAMASIEDRAVANNSLEDVLKGIYKESFEKHLQMLINKKGLKNSEVYAAANISKQYFSKLLKGQVKPSKGKMLALAVGLHLNMDETVDFLRIAGYALSPISQTDAVVGYFIEHEDYNVLKIDIVLFDYGLDPLSTI